jgi:hypothetical protein
MKLKKDIISSGKDKAMYGKKGEEVKVVNNYHGEVAIVMNSKGDKFPVRKENLE